MTHWRARRPDPKHPADVYTESDSTSFSLFEDLIGSAGFGAVIVAAFVLLFF